MDTLSSETLMEGLIIVMEYKALREFVVNGFYSEIKILDIQLDILKASIRSYQESTNRKRIEWKRHGVVGKFIATRSYKTELPSIYEILENHGILHLALKIDWNRLTEEEQMRLTKFIIPSIPYIRIVLFGNQHDDINELKTTNVEQLNIFERVRLWKSLKHVHERKLIQWNSIKRKTLLSMLRKKEENIKLSIGKMNIIQPKPQILTIDVYRQFGIQTLKSAGNIDYTKLNEFIARGFIKKSELNQFRKTTEIDLKYYLMEIHKEKNYIQALKKSTFN